MCGIVGYTGEMPVMPILLQGLRHVEYRGYDSAGVAILQDGRINVLKKQGKIANLEGIASGEFPDATCGIGHTRWATHGVPNDTNAHPLDGCTDLRHACKTRVTLVHNGTLENHHAIRAMLIESGHVFTSQTDTELLAHMIGEAYAGDPVRALAGALRNVEGAYALAILFGEHPGVVFFAKKGGPLHIGVRQDGRYLASDISSFRQYTDEVISLRDGQIGFITGTEQHIESLDGVPVEPKVETVTWKLEEIQKGGHPYFMEKEILTQDSSLRELLGGRLQADGTIKLGGLESHGAALRDIASFIFVAAGTSLHAGMIGKTYFQEIARLHAEYENASELANQHAPCFRDRTAFWAISQSGETTDLIKAIHRVHAYHLPCFGLVNAVGSEIAQLTDAGVYLHVGPERGVASTKAFTGQVLALCLISLYLRQLHGLAQEPWVCHLLAGVQKIPDLVAQTIARMATYKPIIEKYMGFENFLFLGRGVNYPTALEGALKLKEVAYVNAIGHSAGEMKHGPIALIEARFPTMVIALRQDKSYEKVLGNIAEIRARKGRVIAIATDGDENIHQYVDDVLYIPEVDYYLTPILAAIPLQQFAYRISVLKGWDPDQPRNLAKAVTVE